MLSTQEDHRARFFEDYRKEAEEYDREFMKKYDEDLNTTLIFVSFVWSLVDACQLRHRLVSSPPSPLHSSLRSTLIYNRTPTTRPPLSSVS